MTHDEREELSRILNELARVQADLHAMVSVGDPAPEAPADDAPAWFIVAKGELGTREIPGSQHNPRVLEYHAETGLSADDDETPWCSSFANWCFAQVGIVGTRSAAARSWLKWGKALDVPRVGCVVVFSRPPKPGSGHVAFYVADEGQSIVVLGGNQGNAVSAKPYPKSRVLGYRWPT